VTTSYDNLMSMIFNNIDTNEEDSSGRD